MESVRAELRTEIREWVERLKQALLTVENRRRVEAQFKPLPEDTVVWMPNNPNAEFSLLTLKVWSLRYCVTPEFLLDTLTLCFRNCRRQSPQQQDVQLGLPAVLICGPRARQYVEEAVLRAFPNGENYKTKRQPQVRIPRWKRNGNLDLDLEEYTRMITAARNRFDALLKPDVTGRNYRRD